MEQQSANSKIDSCCCYRHTIVMQGRLLQPQILTPCS